MITKMRNFELLARGNRFHLVGVPGVSHRMIEMDSEEGIITIQKEIDGNKSVEVKWRLNCILDWLNRGDVVFDMPFTRREASQMLKSGRWFRMRDMHDVIVEPVEIKGDCLHLHITQKGKREFGIIPLGFILDNLMSGWFEFLEKGEKVAE